METWTETQNGVFEREFGQFELFQKYVGDLGMPLEREQWALYVCLKITPLGSLNNASTSDRDLPGLLRKAWAYLRFAHPNIASYASEDDRRIAYKTLAGKESLESWLARSFIVVDDDAVNVDELAKTSKPAPTSLLYFIPRTGEILYHTAHWRIDGTGAFIIMGELLRNLTDLSLNDPADLPWGEEARRLPLRMEDAPSIAVPQTDHRRELGERFADTWAQGEIVGITYKGDTATPPAAARSLHATFSETQTKAIISASKAHGISVTAAVHGAFAKANYAHAIKGHETRPYCSTLRFSLRPRLGGYYATDECAMTPIVTGWQIKLQPGVSFLDAARMYHGEYQKGIPPEYLSQHISYISTLCERIKAAQQQQQPPKEPLSDVDISSLGILDRFFPHRYGTDDFGVEVDSVDLRLELLARQGGCFIYTFRGKLNLSLAWNEAYHDREQMEEFTQTVKYILLNGLGIPVE